MLPLELAGRRDAVPPPPTCCNAWAREPGWGTTPKCCLAASSGAWPWRGPFWSNPPCCWPTNRQAALDFATGETIMKLMFDLNREQGTTLVLVARPATLPHSANAASPSRLGAWFARVLHR